mgnify:CR=1 FL=1
MKKLLNYKLMLVLIGLTFFVSCQHETEEALEDAATNIERVDVKWLAPDDHPVVQLLYSRGYEKGTIYETEEYFLAPPDLFYSKNIEDYDLNDTGIAPKQAYNTGALVSLNRMRINVFFDGSIGADLQNQATTHLMRSTVSTTVRCFLYAFSMPIRRKLPFEATLV